MSTQARPKLFLLKPSFVDPKAGPGDWFCVHCAMLEGLLLQHPDMAAQLDVHRIDFERPRPAVIAELGEAHQVCPVLVLPPGWQGPTAGGREANGRTFFVGDHDIAVFLATWAGTPKPHP
jgi:hypothetical protein